MWIKPGIAMENRFNLVDEPWIPIAGAGLVSLREVFSYPDHSGLGGNPIQKISLLKFLLAIAQAAATPEDEAAWNALGWRGLTGKCLAYLEQHHDCFFLYGEKPFLQMPAIAAAEVKSCGALLPYIATGNTTVLVQTQIEQPLDDAGKALLLISQMGLALGGKKTDNSVTLTPGYVGKRNDKGKPSSGKPGPDVERFGLLHNFLLGPSLIQTVWLNLLTLENINNCKQFSDGLGTAPWEQMPIGEDCPTAKSLRNSLQGRLVPLSRFCLLTESGVHYSEGINHPGYLDGRSDPTAAVDFSGKKPKAIWVNPEKKPWRELTALLAFISPTAGKAGDCLQIRVGISRVRDNSFGRFAIWSGGLRVSSNAGEQYAAGNDDFVESTIWLRSQNMEEPWFHQLESEMANLKTLSEVLYGCVSAYFGEQKMEKNAKNELAERAASLFWQLCERDSQNLVDACDIGGTAKLNILRRRFLNHVRQIYDRFCPRDTARQLDAWAGRRPNLSRFLKQRD
jgi:CRISPR system Cascade subunit CasA